MINIQDLVIELESFRVHLPIRTRDKSELIVNKVIGKLSQLQKALELAANRFENPKFGCNWKDAADDCRKALNE